MRMLSSLLVPMIAVAAPAAAQQSPQAVLDELFAAERSLSAAAEKLTPAEGIASLMARDGVLMTRDGPVIGPAAAATSLKANPANAGKFASWRPIRGGVSADGLHGFTMGYLDIAGGQPERDKRRYLAYWVKGADGWRVAAFKQTLQNKGEVIVPMQPPALPAKIVTPDPTKTPIHHKSLVEAEKAFSDRAGVVGNHQAFQEYGRPDAIHIFGPTGFRIGLEAIGNQPEGTPTTSQPNWSAETTFVASSGDLGVNVGYIRRAVPDPRYPGPNPFMTIWRRDNPSQPWKYIAE